MPTTQTALGTPSEGRITFGLTSSTVDHGADYVILAADRGKLMRFTGAGPWTATMTASATLGSQFIVMIRNDSALDLTIDTATGNIDGGPTVTLEPGLTLSVVCNGTDCFTAGVNLNSVPLIGGTMTGALILSGDPVLPLGAATKQYVDAAGSGIAVQPLCFAATTANLNATQAGAGVGATLTNAGAMAAFSVDGVSPAINSRILVKNQTLSQHNGCYTLTTVGSGAINWVLTRATDYDIAAEIQPGTLFMVTNGTVNAVTSWVETNVVVTVDTDPIAFAQFTFSPGSYANTALSNLAAVSINTALLPSADNLRDVGTAALGFRDIYARVLAAPSDAAAGLALGVYNTGTLIHDPIIGAANGNPPTAAIGSFVTATTQAANNNSTKIATTAYVDNQVTTAGANRALSNLTGVAVNTTLVSDTDITDDLGTQAIRWRNIYANTLQTGDTAADVLTIGAWDVDGASLTPYITLTANNTPSCVLASGITATTQTINDNSTKLATTAYVNDTVKLGQTNVACNSNITFTQNVNTNQYFKLTFASNCTLAFTFNAGLVQSMCLQLINAGAFTVTWSGVLWAGGAAPAFTAAGTDMVVIWQNGDNIVYGALIGKGFA